MTINRRSFIQTAVAVTASLSAPMVMASGKPRVVVVGGGAGGAMLATGVTLDPGTYAVSIGSGGNGASPPGQGSDGGNTIFHPGGSQQRQGTGGGGGGSVWW